MTDRGVQPVSRAHFLLTIAVMGYPTVYPTGVTVYDPGRAWSGGAKSACVASTAATAQRCCWPRKFLLGCSAEGQGGAG